MLTTLLFNLSLLISPSQAQDLNIEKAVQRELRIYSLEDLLSDFPCQRDGKQALDPDYVHNWADLAARYCDPALDPKQERLQAEDQGYLVAYLRPEQHRWLDQFLRLQRVDGMTWTAEIETRIYGVPHGQLARMPLTGSATLLADARAIALMQKRLEDAAANLISAPRLTMFPGQPGNLSVLNQVAYIKEYELQVIEPGNVEIMDPVVEVIQEGITVDVRALQVTDDLYGIDLTCMNAEVERPIPTKKVKPSPLLPAEFEIGLPVVHTAKVNATVRLADGAGVLLVAAGSTAGSEIAILLTFRRMPLDAPAQARPPR